MKIALDYDGTITADPQLWEGFVVDALNAGHEVTVVTMRYPEEAIADAPCNCEVIYTSRLAKMPFCTFMGRQFDVWIDDNPHFIVGDAP